MAAVELKMRGGGADLAGDVSTEDCHVRCQVGLGGIFFSFSTALYCCVLETLSLLRISHLVCIYSCAVHWNRASLRINQSIDQSFVEIIECMLSYFFPL
jgi:hypothetical protein